MMYGITMYVDGSLELFNITDSMIEGIIKDIKEYNTNVKIEQNDKYISIHNDDSESFYFYNRDARTEYAMGLLNAF
jgi:hypothetical protein